MKHAVHGSAIHHAISMADAELVWILASAGASIEVPDECGHSPLLWAAMLGHQGCVRVLLEAGASVPDRTGQFLRRFDFPAAAQLPAFQALIAESVAMWGPAAPLEWLPGAYWWQLKLAASRAAVQRLQLEYLRRGAFLLLVGRDFCGAKQGCVGLLPTEDKYAAIASIGIRSGDDGEVLTPGVIDWLKSLECTHPFVVEGCGCDFLALRFPNTIDNPRELAQKMLEFCPDMIDHTDEAFENLVQELRNKREVGFWWD
jgi:hypothetical protein